MDDIDALRNLSANDIAIYNGEMQRERKSAGVAYLLWFFLGGFGAHKFYMGDSFTGVFYLMCFIGGWATSFFGIGWFALAVLGIGLLIDLFGIPGAVQRANARKSEAILMRLKPKEPPSPPPNWGPSPTEPPEVF